jgi:hypothetical protein
MPVANHSSRQPLQDPMRPPGYSRVVPVLFWLIVAVQAALPWCFQYFPSCDGISHVHNAEQLWRMLQGDVQLHEYFTLNPLPESNWFGHLLLMLLVRLTSPEIGEKLLLTGYFVLFPLSVRYALRCLRPAAPALPLSWLVLPLSYNWMLHNGFYFNLYSLPVLFLTLGWWWRRRELPGLATGLGLAGLFLLLYFTHVVTLFIAGVTMFSVLAWESRPQPEARTQSPRNAWLTFLLALVPALALCLWVQTGRLGFAAWGDPEVSLTKKLFSLGTLYFGLVSFDKRELAFSTMVALGIWGLTAYNLALRRRRNALGGQDGWLAAALGATLLFLAAPESLAHGWYLVHRLSIYPFLLLILWLGTQPPGPRQRKAIMLICALLALAQLAFYATRYRQLQSYLTEYVELGDQIAPNSTVLALGVSNRGHAPDGRPLSIRTKPFEFGASRIGLAHQCIVLNDYQAHIGYFPLTYRADHDPFTHIGNVLMEPPRFDKGGPLTYALRTGGQVDYVILWRDRTDKMTTAQQTDLFDPLTEGYDFVTSSTPHAYGRLYRRKGLSAALPPSPQTAQNPRK